MQEHCKYLDTVAWNTLLKIIIPKYSKLAERIGPCILKQLLAEHFEYSTSYSVNNTKPDLLDMAGYLFIACSKNKTN